MVDRGGTTHRFAWALAGAVLVLAAGGCSTSLPSATSSTGASKPPGQSVNPNVATQCGVPSTWRTIAPSVAAVPTRLDLTQLGFWTLVQPMPIFDVSLKGEWQVEALDLTDRTRRSVSRHRSNPPTPSCALPGGTRTLSYRRAGS